MKEIIEHDMYIKGELDEKEEDKLWMKFLEDPDRFNRFMTLLNFHALAKKDALKNEIDNHI